MNFLKLINKFLISSYNILEIKLLKSVMNAKIIIFKFSYWIRKNYIQIQIQNKRLQFYEFEMFLFKATLLLHFVTNIIQSN